MIILGLFLLFRFCMIIPVPRTVPDESKAIPQPQMCERPFGPQPTHSNHSIGFYMLWQHLLVHVAIQPPSSPWSDLQDLQCLRRIQLGPGADAATLQLHLECKSCVSTSEIVETCGNSVRAAVVFQNTVPCQPSSRSQEGWLRLPANQSHLECHGAIVRCHSKGSNPHKLAIASDCHPCDSPIPVFAQFVSHVNLRASRNDMAGKKTQKSQFPQPRPTCVVSAMLIFNTKLLRFLWCMRMEEPGSNWSWCDKEHLHPLIFKYSAFFCNMHLLVDKGQNVHIIPGYSEASEQYRDSILQWWVAMASRGALRSHGGRHDAVVPPVQSTAFQGGWHFSFRWATHI